MTESAVQPQPTSPAPPRERKTWDIVLTIVFMVVNLGLNAIGSFVGVMLAFASDSCGSAKVCNTDQIGIGMSLAVIGPWVPLVFVIAGSIVLLVIRRRAFWLPLVGIALTIAIVGVGIALVFGAVGW